MLTTSNLNHDFDIVEGPVANDTVYSVLLGFENGIFSLGFKDLARIKDLTDAAVRNPYSNFNSDKSTATHSSGKEQ